MADEHSSLEPGLMLAGKYRLEHKLAEGGMGVVWVAEHESLGHQVAVKLLRPELVGRDDAAARFRREARAAVKLKSEHVARVFDVDSLDDGTLYMVMELLEGDSLDRIITKQGAMSVSDTVSYLLQMLSALIEAHARGIVHRDLKPSNLFLCSGDGATPKLKVLDFGISKAPDDAAVSDNDLTATSDVLGTPAYMSPEQVVSSKNVDGRSDVWAVGVIAYEMLTGALLFDGETPGAMLASVLNQPIRPLRELRPDVPTALEDAVARCLERDRAERFDSARALYQALAPLSPSAPATAISDLDMADTLPMPTGEAAPQAALITALTWGRSEQANNAERGSRTVLAAMALAVVLVTGGAWWATSVGADADPSPASSLKTEIAAPSTSAVAAPPPMARDDASGAAPTASASATATASAVPTAPVRRSTRPRPPAAARGSSKPKLNLDQRQ